MNALLINTPALDVYQHMALDENLARSADKNKDQFFLRFYNWGGAQAAPSMTFGYAQFFKEIEKEINLKNFNGHAVRRPTGGGIVWHEDDLTFSCVFNSTLTRPQAIYNKLHSAINKFLNKENKQAKMFDTQDFHGKGYTPSFEGSASACFANPVPDDLVDEAGQKILGGAIRRFDNIILYQGSLQSCGARTNAGFKENITKALEQEWDINFKDFSFSEHYLNNVKQIAQMQHTKDHWNKKF